MEEEKKDLLSNITPTDLLAVVSGIPLPPVVRKSLWKAFTDLVGSIADVPVAKLESVSQRIRNESSGLEIVTKAASNAAAKEFSTDPELINRAVNHFGAKLLKSQLNRESVTSKAVDDLRINPPKADTEQEIDSDWLDSFSKIAETKSSEDIQLLLSKILAGEIRKPGTFNTKTIQILSTLDQETAQIFRQFCNISISFGLINDGSFSFVITSPFGPAGNNTLKEFGLNYNQLTLLQDAGLIKSDLNSWRDFPKEIFKAPFVVGESAFIVQPNQQSQDTVRLEGIDFTKAGLELRRVINFTDVEEYNSKLKSWLETQLADPSSKSPE